MKQLQTAPPIWTTPNEAFCGLQMAVNINYLHLHSLEANMMLAPVLLPNDIPESWPHVFHIETTSCKTCLLNVGDDAFIAPNYVSLLRQF